LSSYDGDYVHWADASRHFPGGFSPDTDIHKALAMMNDVATISKAELGSSPWAQLKLEDMSVQPSRPVSAFGIPYCAADCTMGNQLCTSIGNIGHYGYKDMIAEPEHFRVQPHMLLANMIIANTAENRRLVWDWLSMALARPRDWCRSGLPEEVAMDILLYQRSIPYLNTCLFQKTAVNLSAPFAYKGRGTCWHKTKSVNHFLHDMMAGNFVTMTYRGKMSLNGCSVRGTQTVDAPCGFACGTGYPDRSSWETAFNNRPKLCRGSDTKNLDPMC